MSEPDKRRIRHGRRSAPGLGRGSATRGLHDQQQPESQISALIGMGIDRSRIQVDQGSSRTRRHRPALGQATAVPTQDQLVVTRLDRLERSVRDLHYILDDRGTRSVTVAIGQTTYEPSDPLSKLMISGLFAVITQVGMEGSRCLRLWPRVRIGFGGAQPVRPWRSSRRWARRIASARWPVSRGPWPVPSSQSMAS